jgi:hypothetical protein
MIGTTKRVAAADFAGSTNETRARAQSSPVLTYAQQREAKRLAVSGSLTPGRAVVSNGGGSVGGNKQRHANWSGSDDRAANSSLNISRTDAVALAAKLNLVAKAKRRAAKLAPRTQLNLTFAVIECLLFGTFILQSTASSTAVYKNYSASATDAIGAIHEVRERQTAAETARAQLSIRAVFSFVACLFSLKAVLSVHC